MRLQALGLRLFGEPAHRVTSVTTVLAPSEVSAGAVKTMLLDEFNLEIGGGLGEYADHMWRIGIMGHSAQQANVMLLLPRSSTRYAARVFRQPPLVRLPRKMSIGSDVADALVRTQPFVRMRIRHSVWLLRSAGVYARVTGASR